MTAEPAARRLCASLPDYFNSALVILGIAVGLVIALMVMSAVIVGIGALALLAVSLVGVVVSDVVGQLAGKAALAHRLLTSF